MSDSEEKTLPPSPQKLRKLAQQQGRVASSRVVVTFGSLLGGLIVLYMNSGLILSSMQELVDQIDIASSEDFFSRLKRLWLLSFITLFKSAIPIFLGAMFAAIFAAIMDRKGVIGKLSGGQISFNSLNPVNNVKNIFSVRTLTDFLRGTVISIFAVAAATGVGAYFLNDIFWAPTCGFGCAWQAFELSVAAVILVILLILLLEALIDIPISRILFRRDNKMSQSEKKQEAKEDRGSPEVRRERKRLQQEAAQAPRMTPGMAPSIIVTSPEGTAVALYFKRPDTPAPVVIRKAKDDAAIDMRNEAVRGGIPVVEDADIGLNLYKKSAPASIIPRELFTPVAGILIRNGIIK